MHYLTSSFCISVLTPKENEQKRVWKHLHMSAHHGLICDNQHLEMTQIHMDRAVYKQVLHTDLLFNKRNKSFAPTMLKLEIIRVRDTYKSTHYVPHIKLLENTN